MKIYDKKYKALLVLTVYLFTLFAASLHYHELNISNTELHSFEKTQTNSIQHFISQNLCVFQIFLTNDCNLTYFNAKIENQFYDEKDFRTFINPQLCNTFLLNTSLRAPPVS